MFSDETTVEQYTAVVPAAKVILGLALLRLRLADHRRDPGGPATGRPARSPTRQFMASGHPIYWDSVTDTAWTSYEVGASGTRPSSRTRHPFT